MCTLDKYLCPLGEACWWTIHPASKQRSEGEKVRIGDDLILVSVSSERYLVGLFVYQVDTWWENTKCCEELGKMVGIHMNEFL